MTPDISEFSYGFALTNELVGWTALRTAPIFPSLIEEGKVGGGYDVKLDLPGVPLFLQFKRADCLTRSSAREVSKYGLNLTPPFYRFAITERRRSFQHTSLVALDDGNNLVFYAAPRFHTLAEINEAWEAENVIGRSIFIDPKQIGLIEDDREHHVSYDDKNAYFCSEPKPIMPISVEQLRHTLAAKLKKENARPVRSQLAGWLNRLRDAAVRAEEDYQALLRRIRDKGRLDSAEEKAEVMMVSVPVAQPVERGSIPQYRAEIRSGRPLSPEENLLRQLGDQALHSFGAQIYVVQHNAFG